MGDREEELHRGISEEEFDYFVGWVYGIGVRQELIYSISSKSKVYLRRDKQQAWALASEHNRLTLIVFLCNIFIKRTSGAKLNNVVIG